MTWKEQKKKLEARTHLQDVTQFECELATMMISNDSRVHSVSDYWNLFSTYIDFIRRGNKHESI